ncbi:MAG TPA: hypothetical protein VHZ07_21635 [Bryobacteraceae bacterium]|jgi:hypothetical protein|nr:hypothetical protein [Bryobacteraceae bacterium]
MLRDVLLIGLVSAVCWSGSACECQASFGACKEVGISDLVFIGTVQSIQPMFLNRWYGTKQPAMQSLNDAFKNAQEHPSADSLRRVKDAYLGAFPQLDDRDKKQAQMAVTIQEVTSCSIPRLIADQGFTSK